ncbi:hypothetical protein ETAA8_44530 [Anatilimnocola aggregata]|uniref:Uncharacterized protein n=1 Tax=Anatilimnocola aggregata TaxID=2528021 RepID=A0A517YGI9_9BACT|nr:hypothetical protein [Anatilimnocola aggregata]QDU29344.1 hypothetical protein ETAA8_44530 [Anatilimnocola aggregata]
MSQSPGSRWSRWNDRLKIIALGLTLGIAARWVTRAWQASAAPARPAAVEAPSDPAVTSGQ